MHVKSNCTCGRAYTCVPMRDLCASDTCHTHLTLNLSPVCTVYIKSNRLLCLLPLIQDGQLQAEVVVIN